MGQAENPHDQQTERILRELNELKQCLTLMLEDKQAQDMDRRHQESEQEQLQNGIAQLRQALEQGKKRGFWSRALGHWDSVRGLMIRLKYSDNNSPR